MMLDTLDYYKILQLRRNCSTDDIRRHYRHLAKRYHPDLNKSKAEEYTERLRLINEAYSVLSHPDKRREYDRSIKFETKPEVVIHQRTQTHQPKSSSQVRQQKHRSRRKKRTMKRHVIRLAFFTLSVFGIALTILYIVQSQASLPRYTVKTNIKPVYAYGIKINDRYRTYREPAITYISEYEESMPLVYDIIFKSEDIISRARFGSTPAINRTTSASPSSQRRREMEGTLSDGMIGKVNAKYEPRHNEVQGVQIDSLEADITSLKISMDNFLHDIRYINQIENEDSIRVYISDAKTQLDRIKYYRMNVLNDLRALYKDSNSH